MTIDVAFYTCQLAPAINQDDEVLVRALVPRGVRVVAQPWGEPPAGPVTAGILRSTWDYHLRLGEFLRFLEAAPAPLYNPPEYVRWNLDKRYLPQLAGLGVPIVPTHMVQAVTPAVLAGSGEVVVKPAVSLGSYRTHRLAPGADVPAEVRAPSPGGYLVQPFVPEILTDGEWSLLFFDGHFSHAVCKRPAPGDFRVQEHLGGTATPAQASPALVQQAAAVLAALSRVPELVGLPPPLYARVDGVVRDGALLLIELELIEPTLFLQQHPGGADTLARALLARLGA